MLRVAIIYFIVIFLMRLMGKRQIGEMEPFELVITLIIADLATIPMAEQTIPIWYGVVPLVVICLLHFIITFTTQKSARIRDIISGKPVIVIDQGSIDFKQLKTLNMSSDELIEQLRNLNFFDIGDVNYAIVERNGKISVIPKAESMPSTREDMKIEPEESEIFFCIIENGKVIKRGFQELNQTHNIKCITSDIIHKMLCREKDLAFASLSESGNGYVQKKGDGTMESIKITMPPPQETQEKEPEE